MKILLTGGAGYVGSVTTEALLDAGYRVVVFDNLERGHREAIDPRAQLIVGDLRHANEILEAVQAIRPDAVLHFAAFALVAESMEQPELYFHNNVVGGLHLLEAMRRVGVRRIVFSSSCATYGIPDRVPIRETTAQCPSNPYGESKLMIEKMLHWYAELHQFEPISLRYFNACGATERLGEDHEPETHLIPNVLRVALGQTPAVRVFGDDYPTPDGTCIRDYIHVADLADAHIRALHTIHLGAFNLGNGTGFSVREVIATAREVTGHPLPLEIAPRRLGDPPSLVADASRARTLLGWTPRYRELRTIIEHAWAWHQRHPQGYSRG